MQIARRRIEALAAALSEAEAEVDVFVDCNATLAAALAAALAERDAENAKLRREIAIRDLTPEAGGTLKLVVGLVLDLGRFTTKEIVQALPNKPLKEIYNAIGYLRRKKKIQRVAFGCYALAPETKS